jgi:hypothetical protein
MDDEVVQIDEDVIERAHGIADFSRDPPGRQAAQALRFGAQALRFGDIPGRAQGQLVELLAAVVVATGHDPSSVSGN